MLSISIRHVCISPYFHSASHNVVVSSYFSQSKGYVVSICSPYNFVKGNWVSGYTGTYTECQCVMYLLMLLTSETSK
eukprot:c26481_g1_i1 orf=105-335(+)